MIGLGLGKNSCTKPLPKWLTDAGCTFAVNVDRQVRSITNPNSPLQNPLTDVTGKLGKNLFDKLMVTIDSYINFNTGILAAATGYTASGYCKINPATQYFLNAGVTGGAVVGLAYYDTDKNFISGLSQAAGTPPFITPSNAQYLRFTVKNATISYEIVQLELGAVATAYEPYGFNNVLMQNVAGTTADGYVQVALPNGKTPYFFKFDGTDTYGIGVNNADTDVIGTGNFGFPYDFITPPVLNNSFLISKAGLSEGTSQFGLKKTSTGNLQLWLNGVAITVATGLVPNTFYHVVIVREAGVLKCEVNGVETYSQPNVVNILTKPNFRLGAISSNAGGTTHTLFTNIFFGVSAIFQGVNCTMVSVKKAYNKLASDYL